MMKSPATVAAAAGRHGRRSKKKLFGGRKLARTTSLFEKREDEGRISFFSEDELTRSEQEWRLPKPGKDEGEQLVGREILVERWGRGVVADFHDLTEFNKAEGHAVPWGSPHTIRFFESGQDLHGTEKTCKLLKPQDLHYLASLSSAERQADEVKERMSVTHLAYQVKIVEPAADAGERQGERDAAAEAAAEASSTEATFDAVFESVDRDGDEKVSFAEFAAWLTRRRKATQGRVEKGFLREVQEQWSKFDADQSHNISKAEFKQVMEGLALEDWKQATDTEGKVYYFNVHTSEARWTKPSHDKEVGEFLHRHGIHSTSNTQKSYSTEMLTVNVGLALKKLRERPQYTAGCRHFVLFLVYLLLLFLLWGKLADMDNSQGVEMGLRSRINAIQFEVTPGPHLSQSIRATSWDGVRNLGDLHDWTLAAVENLYSDDDFTYSTPEERAEMKRRSLADSWHNTEYTELWGAVGVDTDPDGRRHNCTDWMIETQDSAGTWEMPCEFYERCGGFTDDLSRVVALGGDAATAAFENKSVECVHSLRQMEPTADDRCGEAAGEESGLPLKRKCEGVSGCRYWKELLREACVSNSTAEQWQESGPPHPSYDSGRHVGNVNLYNKPMPWVVLKMHRRSSMSPEEQCGAPGCFSSESDTSNFTGAETGFVYSYNDQLDAFPFFIRLDDEAPERWLGLLEVLRADRWLSAETLDFTMECLVWNANSQVLGSWSIRWDIDSGGQIKKPNGLVLRSFPLTVADPSRRDPGVRWLLGLVILALLVDTVCVVRRLWTNILYKQEYLQMLTHVEVLDDRLVNSVDVLNLAATTAAWFGTLWFACNWFSSSSQVELSELEVELQPFRAGDELDGTLTSLVHTQEALETWCGYRDFFGVFCVFAALRCLIAMTFMRKLEVFFEALLQSREQLSYFVILMLGSGFVFTWICHFFLGRRFFAFRSLQPTMFAIMGPVLGGNSNLEDAVLESAREGNLLSSIVLYWAYTAWIILLIYNVLIAILVDAYEEAKDNQEKQHIHHEESAENVEKLNKMLETVMTQKVEVPACASNVWYIKVPDVKVYSCGCVPLQESLSLDGYEFAVSVVEPWQGILKSNSSASRTTKASFVYVVKVERTSAPSGANDGWPEGFTLQALVKRRRNRGKKGELKNDTAEWLSWVWTACLKWWRSLEARASMRTKNEEERWARSGIDYLDEVLSEFINDKIDLLTREMMTDGSLDKDDSADLERFAAQRDLNATYSFVKTHLRELRKKIDAARTSERRQPDPTVKNRLARHKNQLERFKEVEVVARTDLSHQHIVQALSEDREHPVMGDKGMVTYETRYSPRCPGPLIELFWKAFATLEDEELEEATGPPSTWQQISKLDDKVTAMMQLEHAPDTDSASLPALASSINKILEKVEHIDRDLTKVWSRVDHLADHLAVSQASDSPRPPNLTPPPPPLRRFGSASMAVAGFRKGHSSRSMAAPGGLPRLRTVTGAEDLSGLRDAVAPRSLAVAEEGEEPEPEPQEEERLRP